MSLAELVLTYGSISDAACDCWQIARDRSSDAIASEYGAAFKVCICYRERGDAPDLLRDLHLVALAPDRPVYGFTLPQTPEATNLPDLVSILVRDLIAFQPDGPCHLAGYSFGGAVALEMAHQLRVSGRQVGVVAMIDYGPGLRGWRARARTAWYFLQNLPYWVRDDIVPAG